LQATYWQTHGDPESVQTRNGGVHFSYLAALLKANSAGNGKFFVGAGLTAAGEPLALASVL